MGVRNHFLTSDGFDGDNIFLTLQGERLAKNRLDYTDYLVPSTADTISKMFRKWLDLAAEATRRTECYCRSSSRVFTGWKLAVYSTSTAIQKRATR